jgi:hypothetical protein
LRSDGDRAGERLTRDGQGVERAGGHALSTQGTGEGADRMEPDDAGLHLSGLGSRERNLTPAKARRAE